MRYCVQIHPGRLVHRDDEDSPNHNGAHRDRYSYWDYTETDTIFDFDKIALADKCLAQVLSTSKGSDPRRKYAEYLRHYNEDYVAGERYACEWRGLWVLVLEGYKRREHGKYTGPETVTVEPRVLWARLYGEEPITYFTATGLPVSGHTRRNFVQAHDMNRLELSAAKLGQVFSLIKLSLGG